MCWTSRTGFCKFGRLVALDSSYIFDLFWLEGCMGLSVSIFRFCCRRSSSFSLWIRFVVRFFFLSFFHSIFLGFHLLLKIHVPCFLFRLWLILPYWYLFHSSFSSSFFCTILYFILFVMKSFKSIPHFRILKYYYEWKRYSSISSSLILVFSFLRWQ